MIIYGTKPKSTLISGGDFFCPHCHEDREYDLYRVKTWFTLYFIPVFPVGSGDEHIQCAHCSGTFTTEVIDYDPVKEAESTAETLRRISALFLFDVGRISDTTLNAVRDTVASTTDVEVSLEETSRDAQHAQQANADLMKYCRKELAEYSEDGKLLVILNLRRILESEGELDELEQDRLRQLGKTLKLKKRDVNEILTIELEDDVEEL